jgi:hypothetical protein
MLDLFDTSDEDHGKLLVGNQIGISAQSLIIIFKKDNRSKRRGKNAVFIGKEFCWKDNCSHPDFYFNGANFFCRQL